MRGSSFAGETPLVTVVFGDGPGAESRAWPAGLDPSEWTIVTGPHGKPAFVDHTEVHFNKAHTVGALALVVWDRPVGIDIEAIGRYDERIVRRFFSAAEQRYVHAAPAGVQARFTEVWTRKEALVKWRGDGMQHRFDRFDTTGDHRLHTRSIDGYVVSVCADLEPGWAPVWRLRHLVGGPSADSERGAA